MKQIVFVGAMSVFFLAGCMAPRYTQYERRVPAEAESSAMTKEDVIELATQGVGDDVIIEQIKATKSSFALSTDDIVELKNAGVSETVIRFMIQTAAREQPRRVRRGYYWYPPYAPYYYGYPWYPSFYFGYSYGYFAPRVYYPIPRVHYFYYGPRHASPRSWGYSRH